MLNLVIDIDDAVKIGNEILIVVRKKSGRRVFVSIEAPKEIPIIYLRKKSHVDTNGRVNSGR
jgi:sRNA-binding carbon storage regulator CsrA